MKFHSSSTAVLAALLAFLAACGGTAAPASSPAAASPAPANAGASAKPANASAGAAAPGAKPASSGLASAGANTANASGSTSAAGNLTKITVPYAVISISNLPVFAARDAGIFQKHGLDVNLTYVDTAEVASIMAGTAQIAQGGGPEVVSAAAGGADVLFIATLAPVYSYILEASSRIQTPADLKGKKIGSGAVGSLTDVATRGVLKRLGIDPDKDVSMQYLASPQARTPALLNGQVDAALDSPPNTYKEDAQGLHQLYDLAAQKVPTISNGITVRRDWLNAHRDVAQEYIDAMMEAIGRIKTDKPFAATVLKNYMKLQSAEDAAKAADWTATYLIPDVPTTNVANFADMIQSLSMQNPKIGSLDLNRIVDNSLVQNAVDRGLAHKG